jgi:fatty-acyl-CoA synthase
MTTLELDWSERWAAFTPGDVAITNAETGAQWTWRWLYQASCRLARALAARGVTKGDRVAVLAGSEAEFFPLFIAVQRLGAVLLPLNFRLTVRELEHICTDAEPKVLIVHDDFAAAAAQLSTKARRVPFAEVVQVLADETVPHAHLPIDAQFEDACMVLYTSGTTGFPKGALITHRMMFWNSVSTGLRLDLTHADVSVSFLPFFHTSGWHVLNTPFLHRGARIVFLKKFDAERVLRLCDSEGVTVLFGVPTTLDMMARTPSFPEVTLRTVRFAIVGGEPMPVELIRTWEARNVPVRQGFGLTEFGPNVFSLNASDSVRKMGSIGFPNMYVEARVMADDGTVIEDDRVGELWLRGPACTPGYWRNEAATRDAIRDGWFTTGDLVRRDAEGFFFVAGRKKDMFISGAENVYPVEVERYLSTHPKVREVAVIGVPDPKWGEVGKAFVSARDGHTITAEEVIEFCQGNLARYKIPKHVEVLPELPKGDSGKILKRALKDRERK